MPGPDEFLDDLPVDGDDSGVSSKLHELQAEAEEAEEVVEETGDEQYAETQAERDVMDDDREPEPEAEPEAEEPPQQVAAEPPLFEQFLSQLTDPTRAAVYEMGIKDLDALTAMFDVDLVAPRGKLTAEQLLEVEQWLAHYEREIKHAPKSQPSEVAPVQTRDYQPTAVRPHDREAHLRSLRSTR